MSVKKRDFGESANDKDMTVRELLKEINNRPNLRFFLTAAGIWWIARTLLIFLIAGNVIYLLYRIFNLVVMN